VRRYGVIAGIVNGIAFGGILFVLASGFSLALGVIRIINIAHGAFYMLAVYVALTIQQETGNFLVAALASATAVLILGIAVQRLVLRRFALDPLPQVLSTYGIMLIIAESTRLVWGGYPQLLQTPGLLSGALFLGPVVIPWYRLFLIGMAAIVALLLGLFLKRTRVGAFIRAAVDDEEIAQSIGININWLYAGLFGMAGFLAGLAGALGGPVLGAFQGVEFEVLTLTLIVVVLGGMGSILGAFVGSMLVGIVDALGRAMFPELAQFVLFVPMIVFLALRPEGLFGKREVRSA
jgi:branched-chain amino acid transport system permease protein